MRVWHAYFDTGGSESAADGTVLVTVGAVAEEKKWTRFDQRWSALLHSEGVTALHMSEFAHSTGQFAAWKGNEPRRSSFLAAMTREAKRTINKAFVTVLILPDYRDFDSRFKLTETLGGPYAVAQTGSLFRAFDWLYSAKHQQDQVGFFIEKGDAGQGAFRSFLQREKAIEPIFASRVNAAGEVITPFQVADFIAYEYRYAYARFLLERRRIVPRASMSYLRRMLPLDVSMADHQFLQRFCTERLVPARKEETRLRPVGKPPSTQYGALHRDVAGNHPVGCCPPSSSSSRRLASVTGSISLQGIWTVKVEDVAPVL
jgi:hypothetical protein